MRRVLVLLTAANLALGLYNAVFRGEQSHGWSAKGMGTVVVRTLVFAAAMHIANDRQTKRQPARLNQRNEDRSTQVYGGFLAAAVRPKAIDGETTTSLQSEHRLRTIDKASSGILLLLFVVPFVKLVVSLVKSYAALTHKVLSPLDEDPVFPRLVWVVSVAVVPVMAKIAAASPETLIQAKIKTLPYLTVGKNNLWKIAASSPETLVQAKNKSLGYLTVGENNLRKVTAAFLETLVHAKTKASGYLNVGKSTLWKVGRAMGRPKEERERDRQKHKAKDGKIGTLTEQTKHPKKSHESGRMDGGDPSELTPPTKDDEVGQVSSADQEAESKQTSITFPDPERMEPWSRTQPELSSNGREGRGSRGVRMEKEVAEDHSLKPALGDIPIPPQDFDHDGKRTVRMRELRIRGSLGGISVSAIPDTGSSFDIISEEFAIENNLNIDTRNGRSFRLPNGKERMFLGTVTASWIFSGENEVHHRCFHVLRGCVHQVVLGADFLNVTNTLSKFAHRIKAVLSSISAAAPRKVLFIDRPAATASSETRVLSLFNGHPVLGLPDTCSDISIINRRTARELCQKLGLDILEDHTIEVQFIDGTIASTCGLIRDVKLCFGVTLAKEDMRRLDFHVMDDIPCAVILDKWLLWENKVFEYYRDCFRDWQPARDDSVLGIIPTRKSETKQILADPGDEEIARHTDALFRIRKLPLEQQARALQEEERRQQEYNSPHAGSGLPLLRIQPPSLTTTTPPVSAAAQTALNLPSLISGRNSSSAASTSASSTGTRPLSTSASASSQQPGNAVFQNTVQAPGGTAGKKKSFWASIGLTRFAK
ncbi:unnamed protein product [Clonostachys byssicola]|uniref:Uncharacterized protein n=1 Tax=Clonostachys byssicola TaxID=160290 RepID=A0A9N9U3N2_9HYPO|nr:unnamed protein product [Clonostachys byssicola]